MHTSAPRTLDRGGDAPSIIRGAKPRRHQRSRKRGAITPPHVRYAGRPTILGNPFRADRFGHIRSVKLYRQWLARTLTISALERLGFNHTEIDGLIRWRNRLDHVLPEIRGVDLQCWCPLSSRWCHVDALIDAANA